MNSRKLGIGPRCSSVPAFEAVDTFNTRAPMSFAELLSRLAEGKKFVEIGTRKGDIFSCVAHYANHTTVVEGAAMYCPDIIARVRSSTKINVRCPELYPTRGHIDADLFYFWMQPKLSLNLLKSLRNGVKAGQVRPTAVMAVTTFPLASTYNKTGAKPVYIWGDLDLTRLASRTHLVLFEEDANIGSRRRGDREIHIRSAGFLLEFDLGDPRFDNATVTKEVCKAAQYSPEKCPVPKSLEHFAQQLKTRADVALSTEGQATMHEALYRD